MDQLVEQGDIHMAYEKGDIVRHKFRAMKGLYEISATFNHHIYQYLITND